MIRLIGPSIMLGYSVIIISQASVVHVFLMQYSSLRRHRRPLIPLMYVGAVLLGQSVDIIRRVTVSSQPWWCGGVELMAMRLEGGMESEFSLQAVVSIQDAQVMVG